MSNDLDYLYTHGKKDYVTTKDIAIEFAKWLALHNFIVKDNKCFKGENNKQSKSIDELYYIFLHTMHKFKRTEAQ